QVSPCASQAVPTAPRHMLDTRDSLEVQEKICQRSSGDGLQVSLVVPHRDGPTHEPSLWEKRIVLDIAAQIRRLTFAEVSGAHLVIELTARYLVQVHSRPHFLAASQYNRSEARRVGHAC